MINDEMRELLSSYVDGELRDADAARVEDVSRRDPELRREIEAYRTLRRKLREWDAADHGALPSASFLGRALERARAMDAALAVPARVRFLGPLAAAAAILVAAGAGAYLARSMAPAAPPLPGAGTPVALKPLGEAPDLALEGSALAPLPPPGPAAVVQRIDDHIPSRRAVELEQAMRREELVRAVPPDERRSRPPLSGEISAMLEGCTARPAPRDSLVVLARPASLPGLASVLPVPSDRRRGLDSDNTGKGRIIVSSDWTGDMVAPLGEVWMAPKSGRTRIVAASEWIAPRADNWVRVVWGDGTDVPRVGELLGAQETILGPKARRRLLSAKPGPDADFLDWLKGAYGALPEALAADRDRDRAMNKLVDALRADEAATGFAVLDAKGNLLGVEIFHDHASMLGFAPRLLRGYLLEAGEDGIRVTPPLGANGLAKVQGFLEAMPARGLRVEREKLEGAGYERAPKGLCRANLVGQAGQVIGHGIFVGDTPIHLTVFPE